MPTAYAYLRFSHPSQIQGDSLRRQRERVERYIAARGDLQLDTTLNLKDLGVSAYSGDNRRRGALAAFLAAVESGRIARGSVLLIEAIDRLTRENTLDAISLIDSILKAGIEVVTLEDGASFTRETLTESPSGIWMLIGKMQAAHNESRRKSDLLGATWRNKKKDATATLKPISRMCPSWLRLSDGQYEIIPNRAQVVKEVFELTVKGIGKDKIARMLNERNEPLFDREGQGIVSNSVRGRGWHGSSIAKLLTNRAVLGEFQPHVKNTATGRRAVNEGDPVANYYPAVIDQILWDRASAARAANRGQGGRKGKHFRNLLTGLCICGVCGGKMTYRDKGVRRPEAVAPRATHREQEFLVCDNALRGRGCDGKAHYKYKVVEQAILGQVDLLLFASDVFVNEEDGATSLEREKAELGARISKRQQNITSTIEAMDGQVTAPIQASITHLSKLIEHDNARLAEIDKEISAKRGTVSPQSQITAVKKLRHVAEASTEETERYTARAQIHAALRSLIDVILFEPGDRTATVYAFASFLSFVVRPDGTVSDFGFHLGGKSMFLRDGKLSDVEPDPSWQQAYQQVRVMAVPGRLEELAERVTSVLATQPLNAA